MAMSEGFQAFFREAPEVAAAWLGIDQTLAEHSALDPKTAELAYLAVLAALGLERGIAFHAAEARRLGALRNEVRSAVLIGLPTVGNRGIEPWRKRSAPSARSERSAAGDNGTGTSSQITQARRYRLRMEQLGAVEFAKIVYNRTA